MFFIGDFLFKHSNPKYIVLNRSVCQMTVSEICSCLPRATTLATSSVFFPRGPGPVFSRASYPLPTQRPLMSRVGSVTPVRPRACQLSQNRYVPGIFRPVNLHPIGTGSWSARGGGGVPSGNGRVGSRLVLFRNLSATPPSPISIQFFSKNVATHLVQPVLPPTETFICHKKGPKKKPDHRKKKPARSLAGSLVALDPLHVAHLLRYGRRRGHSTF